MQSKAQELMDHVNSVVGKDSLRRGSDPYFQVDYQPTGVCPIDDLLQGGIPRGRFVEIFGQFSSLKSYIGLRAIASYQKSGYLCALIDSEHAYDPEWAENCGVDVENLVLKQPDTGEEAIDICEVLIRGGVDLVVFDSVAATLPRAEQQTKMSGDKAVQPGRLAYLMSVGLRKLTAANKTHASIIWINQTRQSIGMHFGNPETTTGGKALGFYSSYRIAFRKAGKIQDKVEVTVTENGRPTKKKMNRVVGQSIRATVEKSKLTRPYREVMFDFNYSDASVDDWYYLVTRAMDSGLIEYRNGIWTVKRPHKQAVKRRGKENLRAEISEKELRERLQYPRGEVRVANSKDDLQKNESSKSEGRTSTQTRARAASKKMGTRMTSGSKSKTPTRRIKSKRAKSKS